MDFTNAAANTIKMTTLSLALSGSFAYVALCPAVAMPLYSHFLFYPDITRNKYYDIEEIRGIKKEELRIPSTNHKRLHAFYFHNPQSPYVVLVSHGNAGNISHRLHLADAALAAGASVLVYDYQGFGQSEGEPSLPNVCSDGVAVFDYLVNEKGYKNSQIILFGESLGTGISCQIAQKRDCAAIILQSPFRSLPAIGKEKLSVLKLYPSILFPHPILDNMKYVAGKHPPLLIMHGRLDQLIPVEHAEALYAAASEPKKLLVLERAAHNDVFHADHDRSYGELKAFISSLQPQN